MRKFIFCLAVIVAIFSLILGFVLATFGLMEQVDCAVVFGVAFLVAGVTYKKGYMGNDKGGDPGIPLPL